MRTSAQESRKLRISASLLLPVRLSVQRNAGRCDVASHRSSMQIEGESSTTGGFVGIV